ncbi:translation elongation factor Ts [Helicobacter trogontum]|uniref:Elongation factor Ts n=1 Tax=Helicobacter trogontum TaxID=50960 RepID=A0A4U8TGR7_9HELI|nr:translation elongation factor Ts [Helicobacter trogontum]MDY5185445.1 translation elongation factor Ts [Helicobacter trogontum]TLD99391.1 elongation factor Ts [Helicobacter trogontum]
MQEISAKVVAELRKKTDAGIMECKNALKECKGNIEEAIEYLRKKGLSKAAKKADRIAAEGVIAMKIADDFTKATLVEVNSETDFVAKNDDFQEIVANILDLAFKRSLNTTESLMQLSVNGESFEDYLKQKIAIIGENIVIRRVATITCKPNQLINGYLHHNKKVGAITLLSVEKEENVSKLSEFSKLLSMHIASMKPKFLSYKELDKDFVAKERVAIAAELEKENEELARLKKPLHRIPEFVSRSELTESVLQAKEEELRAALKAEGKPETIWDKILPGQLDRFILDNTILDQRLTLLAQLYALDDKKTITQVLDEKSKELNDNIQVISFTNFELGEGIEKKVDNFAEEVAEQMK